MTIRAFFFYCEKTSAFSALVGSHRMNMQGLLGTYLYVPVEVSEDNPGEEHTKPQKVKVNKFQCAT